MSSSYLCSMFYTRTQHLTPSHRPSGPIIHAGNQITPLSWRCPWDRRNSMPVCADTYGWERVKRGKETQDNIFKRLFSTSSIDKFRESCQNFVMEIRDASGIEIIVSSSQDSDPIMKMLDIICWEGRNVWWGSLRWRTDCDVKVTNKWDLGKIALEVIQRHVRKNTYSRQL